MAIQRKVPAAELQAYKRGWESGFGAAMRSVTKWTGPVVIDESGPISEDAWEAAVAITNEPDAALKEGFRKFREKHGILGELALQGRAGVGGCICSPCGRTVAECRKAPCGAAACYM